MSFTRINVERARELIERSAVQVVDVRDAASFQAGHIPDAESIDNMNVESYIKRADMARPLIVCCYHGNMSQGAAEYFSQRGFRDTYSLDGGYEAWQMSGGR